jgi:hypothetical protein
MIGEQGAGANKRLARCSRISAAGRHAVAFAAAALPWDVPQSVDLLLWAYSLSILRRCYRLSPEVRPALRSNAPFT